MTQWDHYQSLLAVLEAGSLSGAARVLGLTQPTLSRQIGALEADLGQRLFVRTQQGLRPTDVALALEPHARAMANHEAVLRRTASGVGDKPAGTVRLSVSEIVGAEILPPIVAEILQLYPEIELELVLTNAITDLLQGEADIAVRMARPTQAALVARKIGMVRDSIYAHADYLARHLVSADEGNMRDQTLVGFDLETPLISKIIKNFGIVRGDCAIRTDSDLARLALIRAGVGIGLVPDCVACRDPKLVRLSPKYSLTMEVWLAMHEDQRGIARVRAVFDVLAERLKPFATAIADPGAPPID